jgi:hypothetical protein
MQLTEPTLRKVKMIQVGNSYPVLSLHHLSIGFY